MTKSNNILKDTVHVKSKDGVIKLSREMSAESGNVFKNNIVPQLIVRPSENSNEQLKYGTSVLIARPVNRGAKVFIKVEIGIVVEDKTEDDNYYVDIIISY